jgi:hypothetical protein
MNDPSDRPPRSPALEDELAALELLLEDAKRKRQQAEPKDVIDIDEAHPLSDAETSPSEE